MKRNSFGGAPFVFCENICYTGLHKLSETEEK